jgi:hypothetical protein
MRKFTKYAGLAMLLTGYFLTSFADRGVRSKSKNNRVVLNITSSEALKKKITELKSSSNVYLSEETTSISTFKTYQKGNTVYILPAPQKILTTEVKQGYTGMKLIIKSR